MEKKGNTGVIIAVLVVIAFFIGLIIWRTVDKPKIGDYNANTYISANEDNGGIADHVKGDLDKAKVVLVEYADYQCSACALHNPRINKLIEEYAGDLALIYRSYLISYHQNGTAAASAAEAAGLQGYWKEYADKLFTNQSVWSSASGDERTDIFVNFFNAVTNGQGDEAKFRADMVSEAVKKKINFDCTLGEHTGKIEGTPTFFLDGEKIDFSGAKGEEGFLQVFREKIDEKLGK